MIDEETREQIEEIIYNEEPIKEEGKQAINQEDVDEKLKPKAKPKAKAKAKVKSQKSQYNHLKKKQTLKKNNLKQ